MRKPLTFFELQLEQRRHDERNHADIHTLSLFDKMNHYILHFAKYAARLTPKKTEEEIIKELKRTFTDSFLISLASANALNMDLDKEIRKKLNKTPGEIKDFITSSKKMNLVELKEYSRNVLVMANGAMADTMEKRDHLDDKDTRTILQENILKIILMLISGANHVKFDLVETALERRRLIADLKIM